MHFNLCRLYLRNSFMGKTFPKGDPISPEERRRSLLPELLLLLFRENYKSPQCASFQQSQTKHQHLRGFRALSYPYIRALISVDARVFLECLSLVLEDPVAGFAQTKSQHGNWVVERNANSMTALASPEKYEKVEENRLDTHQLVSILSSIIMADSMTNPLNHFGSGKHMTPLSKETKPFFLDFLAKYLRLGVFTLPKDITLEVIDRLCNKKRASEDDILALLHALPQSSIQLEKVLLSVERVSMTRAALFLHKVAVTTYRNREGVSEQFTHHFNRSIDCYLKDSDVDFKKEVFFYAKQQCSGDNSSTLRNIVAQRLPELITLDSVLAAQLVCDFFTENIDMILSSLRDIESGRVEYELLHAIISGDLGKVDSVAAQEISANLTVDHHNLYLRSMTKFQPDSVYQYLSNNRDYRLSDALKLCQDEKITDASAYLLERTGDISGALNLMLETLDSRIVLLRNILRSSCSSRVYGLRIGRIDPKSAYRNEIAEKEIRSMKQILSAILDICERNKDDHLISEKERGPLLWFHVLDRLVNAKNMLCISKDSVDDTSTELSTVLSEMLLLTMQRMITNVSLYELMHKVTRDHAGSNLGEFREMLVGMLKTYRSELVVCSSAVDVMHSDVRHLSYEKKKVKVRGSFAPDCPHCPPELSRNWMIAIGSDGNCEVRSRRSVNRMSHSTVHNAVSWLQHRRRAERGQIRRCLSGGLRTASEFQIKPRRFEAREVFRQVGSLLEAQNVGGLL